MPELKNPRWERFAREVAIGIGSKKDAYIAAGYKAREHSAETAASRLMRTVQPVVQRVKELVEAEHQENRFTRDEIGKRLVKASEMAEHLENPQAITAAEQAIAKLYGIQVDKSEVTNKDESNPKTMAEIAEKCLHDIGHVKATPQDIEKAIEVYMGFLASLEAIRDGENRVLHS